MSTENQITEAPGTRVFQHPQARIKPIGADTLHEARTCIVYEGGQAVAQLKRCGRRCWGVYPAGMTIPAVFGASALEAVTTWLSSWEAEGEHDERPSKDRRQAGKV